MSHALAWALLHSLWQGAAVALALALTLRGTRNSRIRYAASCLAMVLLLAGLVVTFTHLAPEPPSANNVTGVGRPPAPASDLRHGSPGASPRVTIETDYVTWIPLVWMTGVFAFYLRGLASWMSARRLRRTGVCCAPEAWRIRMDRLRDRLLLSTPVTLLESSLAEVPVVVGYLRPVILMPVGLLTGLPASQVEAILLHELAHIGRYDYLVNLLQVLVEGLLFYHPAVWWISGVMRTEREYCCDDVVVAVTGGAHEYATALEFLERRRTNAGMALAATDGSLLTRIQRLLCGAGDLAACRSAVMPLATAAILTITAVASVAALQVQPADRPPVAPRAASVQTPDVTPQAIAQVLPSPKPEHKIPPADATSPVDNSITVVGDVKIPGQFNIDGQITLLEALAKAGWITPAAGPELLLTVPGSDTPRKINIEQLQTSQDPAINVPLKGGEIINVPDAPKIQVIGNVARPYAVPIRKPSDATVLKVVAGVEGLTQYYAKTAYIYRKDEQGATREIAVPLKDIMNRKAQDVPLMADDVLFIPGDNGLRPQFYDPRPPVSPWEGAPKAK